jgi:hypothetical protein
MGLPPAARHERLARLHEELNERYRRALRNLSPETAARPLSDGSDPRPVAQIIGHIAAWERFGILAVGDMLAGIERPRMMTGFGDYREPDGTIHSFATIDAFNAYNAERFAGWSWERLSEFAEDTTNTIYALFTHPHLLNAERLQRMAPFRMRLQGGAILDNITLGWGLWLIMLEHPGVEHAAMLDEYGSA